LTLVSIAGVWRHGTDLEAHEVPTWSEVQNRRYEPWDEPRLVIDTSSLSTSACIDRIARYIDG
jgi:hypothetical protein